MFRGPPGEELLGAVSPALLTLPVAKQVVVGDLPNRRLRTVALPVASLARAPRTNGSCASSGNRCRSA
jgi:hypothetical protein